MASVSLDNVEKSFGAQQVIRGVSLDVDDGDFVCLVGPSGCGKSTLLRMIAGLEEINRGEVRIDGRNVSDLPPKERDIAMVFQNYALYPHMTVAENMAFSLRIRRAPKPEIVERTQQAARILSLEELLGRYPRELSGGQRQRVAMGRAIVRSPKVFLFDEPLSNLDAKLRVQMRSEIKQLHQRLRTTTIYVTHDQIEAMTMADKIVVMRDGWIEQAGPALDVYDEPANLFVAGFIGSPAMNFITGECAPAGGVFRAVSGDVLPMPKFRNGGDPKRCILGVRPEHVRIADQGADAEVLLVEPTGSETQVTVQSCGGRLVVLLRDRVRLRPGERVRLTWDVGAAHCFDAESGVRLASRGSSQGVSQSEIAAGVN